MSTVYHNFAVMRPANAKDLYGPRVSTLTNSAKPMSSSSDEDELEDGQYEMSSESKKFGLMSKHRDKVGAILTSAKNGKLNRLRSQLEEYAAEHRKEAQKEKSKESAQGEGSLALRARRHG